MRKKIQIYGFLLIGFLCTMIFVACGNKNANVPTLPSELPPASSDGQSSNAINESEIPVSSAQTPASPPEESTSPADSDSLDGKIPQKEILLKVEVGTTIFIATLYQNPSTAALIEQLPTTITMGELNGNEKYYFMATDLPINPEQVGMIAAGDLMLYGEDCLVLFYENILPAYLYTKLGHIEDTSGLADALGSATTEVSLSLIVEN